MFIYLFNDNFATSGISTDAIMPCHTELSKYNNAGKTLKTKRKCKNEYTVSLASTAAFQKFFNSIKYSIWSEGPRIRHTIQI